MAKRDIATREPEVTDPKIVEFLSGYSGLQNECALLRDRVDDCNKTIASLNDRNDLLHNELQRTQHQRDEFQRGYFSLKAQLSMLAISAISACQQVTDAATKAVTETREEMKENGVKDEPPAELNIKEVMEGLEISLFESKN